MNSARILVVAVALSLSGCAASDAADDAASPDASVLDSGAGGGSPLADGGTGGGSTGGGGALPDGGSGTTGGGAGGGAFAGGLRPLNELASGTYLGFPGGLYVGSNTPPAEHLAAGLAEARAVVPRRPDGSAGPGGKYVLLSLGMSNTTQEFCSARVEPDGGPPCASWSFVGQALADPLVAHAELALVNGAMSSQVAETWVDPSSPNYERIRDERLAPLGLTEAQVQVVWVKVANPGPKVSLPDAAADAYRLLESLGTIARTLHGRYPNLRQVFFSSRIYAGNATSPLNPEPYAYESGFSVQWLIEAQSRQRRGLGVDARAGDLGPALAPFLDWGPYLWAAGTEPRVDGLSWSPEDFEPKDGTHPSQSAERKVGAQLLGFFKASALTRCWFLAAHPSCE